MVQVYNLLSIIGKWGEKLSFVRNRGWLCLFTVRPPGRWWPAGWELWFAGFIQVEAWDNGSVGVFGGRNALIGKVL